jgi:hypothetical protein
MRYWRCWPIFNGFPFDYFWPVVGHSIHFQDGYALCERCPWREPLPVFFG